MDELSRVIGKSKKPIKCVSTMLAGKRERQTMAGCAATDIKCAIQEGCQEQESISD